MNDTELHSRKSISHQRQKPMKVVFDLDCVLISDIGLVSSKDSINDLVKNIGEDSVIESCGYYFYLYNGWKELIKYVMKLSDNNLIFFSSGAMERNEDIIPKMLERVLERDSTEYIRKHVKIFSRHHTLDTSKMPTVEREKFQPFRMVGNLKKDLTVAVSQEELKHTLLIDDDQSYVLRGQEKNFLKIDGSNVKYQLSESRKLSRVQTLSFNMNSYYCRRFCTLNKLFYAAGVLKDVTDKYYETDRDLIDIMWDDHGFKVTGTNSYDYKIPYELCYRLELYQSGLEVLKEFDNDVGFLVDSSES
eukprot:gene8034-16465_t